MTTYNSYEAAKIANPGSEIYSHGKLFTESNGGPLYPDESLRYWVKCDPADHCITVEKFLADGYEITAGDIVLAFSGAVVKIKGGDINRIKNLMTSNNSISLLGKEYILRAAALEEKKPRTKVEYVNVKYSTAWQAAKDHEERVEFLYRQSDLSDAIKGNNWKAIQSPSEAAQYHFDLYRRIETPMTEREVFIGLVEDMSDNITADGSCFSNLAELLFDSGKFKLVDQ